MKKIEQTTIVTFEFEEGVNSSKIPMVKSYEELAKIIDEATKEELEKKLDP